MIKVTILLDGISAIEINQFGERQPQRGKYSNVNNYIEDHKKWWECENKLRTFKIYKPHIVTIATGKEDKYKLRFKPGKKYSAEVIDKNTVKIIE